MRCASVLKQMPSAPLFSLLGAAKLHFFVGAVPQHMLRLNNLKHSSASSYCNHEQYWPGAVCRAANRSSQGHTNTQKQHGWATSPSARRKRPKALQATIIVQKSVCPAANPTARGVRSRRQRNADSISLLAHCSCRTSAADQADDALLAHGLPGAAAYGSRLDASSKLLTGAPQESVLRRWLNMHQASPSSVSLAQQALSLS